MEPEKIDWDKPLKFGNYPARLVGEINDDEHPYVVAIDYGGYEDISVSNEYGQMYDWNGLLTNAPQKHVKWVNVYPTTHATREEADKRALPSRIACVRIEFEEGEGL